MCSEEVIPSYHTTVTYTCTCTCTPFAFLALPTPCTSTHALHSLKPPTLLALFRLRLPQAYIPTRDEGKVDRRFHTSSTLLSECMGSPISLSYISSRWGVLQRPASSVSCVTADHSSHGMMCRVVHHVGSHTTTHHHHHITSSLYTSLCRSYHITFSVATDSYHLTCDTTDPGGPYRHSRARNPRTLYYRSCTHGKACEPWTMDPTYTASAGVSWSQLSLARQASFDRPAHLDSHARVPSSRVAERWHLCPAPLGWYKAFGHEHHLASGSPKVEPSPPSGTSSLSVHLRCTVLILSPRFHSCPRSYLLYTYYGSLFAMLNRVLLASRGGALTITNAITNVNATVNATVIMNSVNTTVNAHVLDIFESVEYTHSCVHNMPRVHIARVHTSCNHTACVHSSYVHRSRVHSSCVHTYCVYTLCVHTPCVHTSCNHTACVHTACVHTMCVHTICFHTSCVHNMCVHISRVHTPCVHTSFIHT